VQGGIDCVIAARFLNSHHKASGRFSHSSNSAAARQVMRENEFQVITLS